MPRLRPALATLAVAGALVAGCASSAPRAARAAAKPPDPGRWERAACLHDRYPPEIDDGAVARARLADVKASNAGEWSTFEAARIQDRRDEFRERCAVWREAAARETIAKGPPRR